MAQSLDTDFALASLSLVDAGYLQKYPLNMVRITPAHYDIDSHPSTTVTLTGAILFLLFSMVYFYESWTYVPDVPSLDLDLPMKAVERI